jgi:hypothetical protein
MGPAAILRAAAILGKSAVTRISAYRSGRMPIGQRKPAEAAFSRLSVPD